MTCEEYLDRQERLALQSLSRATRITGAEVERAIDLEGHVRRRPVLALGLSALAGFTVGNSVGSAGRGVTRGAFRSVWSPLLRPTLGTLGSMLAKMLLGAMVPPQN